MQHGFSFTKRAAALLLAFCLVLSLVACNKKDNDGGASGKAYLTPAEASQYVLSLGSYSGVEVDLTTSENVQAIQSAISSLTPNKVMDRPIQEGDTVNIDYTGRYKSTGEVFEGGTASGASLTIGSGAFIPGFEEGLIGVIPLEDVTLHLTFPKDYHNKDFAGVEVTFAVMVNYIESYNEEDIEAAEQSVAVAAVVEKAFAESAFAEELPNAFVDAKVNLLVSEVEATAEMMGMDLESYLNAYFQMSTDEMKEQALEYAVMEAQTEIMYLAIAHKEGIALTDEEFQSEVKRLAAEYGYEEDTAAFMEDYGGEDDVRNAVFLMKISDHIASLTVIKK